MDKIYDGNDKAKEKGFATYRDLMIALGEQSGKKWSGNFSKSSPVYARVDFGRWIADCECGGASYVTIFDINFFFCATCGNQSSNGDARAVIFPPNINEIENELLQRQVKAKLGTFGTDAAMNSIGVISRSWSPGETIETLKHQRNMMEKSNGL